MLALKSCGGTELVLIRSVPERIEEELVAVAISKCSICELSRRVRIQLVLANWIRTVGARAQSYGLGYS